VSCVYVEPERLLAPEYAIGSHLMTKSGSARFGDGTGIDKVATNLWTVEHGIAPAQAYFPEDPRNFFKTAAAKDYMPELQEFLSKLKPDNVHIYVLINAMGASEWYGQNSNGDIWEEDQISHDGEDHGYKTFLKGHYFRHHVNDHPKHAIGDIVFSGYHCPMHRLELVTRLSPKKAPKTAERVRNGEFLPHSIGIKVAGDICTVCDQFSTKVADYCSHLRQQMGDVLTRGPRAGLKVGARNIKPRGFDISEVLIPADKTSWSMADVTPRSKYASASIWTFPGWKLAELVLASDKQAEIEKEIPAVGITAFPKKKSPESNIQKAAKALRAREPKIPNSLLAKLGREYSTPQVLSSFSYLGIPLRPNEFQYLLLTRGGHEKLASDLAGMGYVFSPGQKKLPGNFALGADLVQPEVINKIATLVPSRSLFHPYLTARYRQAPEPDIKLAAIRTTHKEPELLQTISGSYTAYLEKLDELWTTEEGIEKVASAPMTNVVFCRLLDDSPLERTANYQLIGETEVSKALISSITNPDKELKLASSTIHSRVGNLPICQASPEALALLDPDEASHWLIERLG